MDKIRKKMEVAPITEKMMESRLRWNRRVARSDPDSVAAVAASMEVHGSRP